MTIMNVGMKVGKKERVNELVDESRKYTYTYISYYDHQRK